MFRRILHEDWIHTLPVIAFFLFATIFIAVSIRALRMNKESREHLASLPLDSESDK